MYIFITLTTMLSLQQKQNTYNIKVLFIFSINHVVCLSSLKKEYFFQFFTFRFNFFQIQTTIFNLLFPVTYLSGIFVVNHIEDN